MSYPKLIQLIVVNRGFLEWCLLHYISLQSGRDVGLSLCCVCCLSIFREHGLFCFTFYIVYLLKNFQFYLVRKIREWRQSDEEHIRIWLKYNEKYLLMSSILSGGCFSWGRMIFWAPASTCSNVFHLAQENWIVHSFLWGLQ